ncbi:MAG: glycosyltransferase [Chitinophagales bacterium]
MSLIGEKINIFEHNNSCRIVVAPLNWGLGHATRCMPIINALLQKGVTVIIASDGRALALLREEYPTLQYIELPAYDIRYSGHALGLVPTMLWQIPKILKAIRTEQKAIQQIVEIEKVDAIISDNRYGCYSPAIPSVFVSHQLFLKMPFFLQFLEPMVAKTQMRFIRPFNHCWIPDFSQKDQSLSGDLAHKEPLAHDRFRFVGALSRMRRQVEEKFVNREEDRGEIGSFLKERYDIVAVLSGPEPQRTVFEEMLQQQVFQTDLDVLIVRGVTEKQSLQFLTDRVQAVNYLAAKELNWVLLAADVVIARSGYSTIMDLAALGKKAILIPTPGQTEQSYLSAYFQSKGVFYCTSQSKFDLKTALKEVENYSGFGFEVAKNHLLEDTIENLLKNKTPH